mmetsp:Transcript_66460/g.205552  ORF Transcript_66460/g.205552 Transcript_66460/m.205552 type:complete len:201 (-) Transcript_66460:305-907(-)
MGGLPTPLPLATSKESVQEEGKSSPAQPAAKALLQKCSLRCPRMASSSRTSARSLLRYITLVSGGTKRSPSSRRSERCGLKTARKRSLSSLPSTGSLASPSAVQNVLPTAAWASGRPTLPQRAVRCTRRAAERPNLSRLRSTPFGARAPTESLVVPADSLAMAPKVEVRSPPLEKAGPAARAAAGPAPRRKRSRPNCTPP